MAYLLYIIWHKNLKQICYEQLSESKQQRGEGT